MSTLRGTVEIVDGKPYFTHREACYLTPERCTSRWALPQHCAAFDGADAEWSSTGGPHYVIHTGRGAPLILRAADDKPDLFAREPIAPPRTRLPVRWNRGRWERHTARGWK